MTYDRRMSITDKLNTLPPEFIAAVTQIVDGLSTVCGNPSRPVEMMAGHHPSCRVDLSASWPRMVCDATCPENPLSRPCATCHSPVGTPCSSAQIPCTAGDWGPDFHKSRVRAAGSRRETPPHEELARVAFQSGYVARSMDMFLGTSSSDGRCEELFREFFVRWRAHCIRRVSRTGYTDARTGVHHPAPGTAGAPGIPSYDDHCKICEICRRERDSLT